MHEKQKKWKKIIKTGLKSCRGCINIVRGQKNRPPLNSNQRIKNEKKKEKKKQGEDLY